MDLLQHFTTYLSISTDSRTVMEGDIFFALKGENFDGNSYASKALELGASLVVVDDATLILPEGRFFLVDDVLTALQQLAHDYRKLFNVPVLAITGSNGKTTTKELIAAVLSKKFEPLVTKGNLNNHIGVPLTLLSARKNNDFFIIEMGANHIGEIALLSKIAQPDYGLITNIGKAHLEGFGGEEGVKQGKSELYKFIANNQGTIFCNSIDPILITLLPEGANTIVYDVLEKIEVINSYPKIIFNYKSQQFDTQLFGIYNLPNIAAAIAIGEHFGLTESEINGAICNYIPTNNRSEISYLNDNVIIKDAYNANPSSLMASLKAFIDIQKVSNQIIIIGDMLELGDASAAEHEKILDFVSNYNLFRKIFIGPRFYQFRNKFDADFYKTVSDASMLVDLSSYSQMEILLKGSRGIAVEKILKSNN